MKKDVRQKTLNKMKIELFDFLRVIGAYIEFNGSFSPTNTYVNANIKKDGDNFICGDGWSLFGRSETPDFDEALSDLTQRISEKEIKFTREKYNVPKLVHTKGYRG